MVALMTEDLTPLKTEITYIGMINHFNVQIPINVENSFSQDLHVYQKDMHVITQFQPIKISFFKTLQVLLMKMSYRT